MTQVFYEVPETYETMTRPIVYNVIDQLELLTTIARDIRVLFPGQTETSYQIGSTVNPTSEPNTFMSQGQLTVKIEENYVEDRVLSTAVLQRENLPIFNDKSLGVMIRPIYSFNEITMSFTYRAPNQVQAKRFRDDLKLRRSMGRVENLHELNYSYGIPLQFFPILKELHALRENVAPYGETYEQWFGKFITPKATVVTNMAGKEPSIVIREPQIGVLGWFDHLVTVEAEDKRDESGAMEVNFTYHIQFDKPLACVMNYPLVIHNQLVPEEYRGSGHIYELSQRLRNPGWSRYLFDRFTPLYPSDVSGIDGVQSPVFDDWRPSIVYPDTSSLLTLLLQIDPNDPMDVANLTNLGEYNIDPDILGFLVGEAPYLTSYNLSAVNLSIYEDGMMMGPDSLTVDSALNVRTTFPMDLRKVYHLRLSLVNNLLGLPSAAQQRMRTNGVACLKILSTLEAGLPGGVQLPQLVAGQLVSRVDFEAAATRINAQKTPLKSQLEYVFMVTVGNFLIATAPRG